MITPEQRSAYNKQYYLKNKTRIIAQNKRWAEKNRDKTRAYGRRAHAKRRLNKPVECLEATRSHKKNMLPILLAFVNYAKASGCSRCNEKHPACLDFHHVDRHSKNEAISRMVRQNRSIRAIEEEMKKCVLLCSNCHRKEHVVNKALYADILVR